MTTPKRTLAFRIIRDAFMGLMGFISVAALVSVLVVSQRNTDALDILKDCTQPSGHCYKNGQAQTGKAIGELTRRTRAIVIIAAYCARIPDNDSVDKITNCVIKQLP